MGLVKRRLYKKERAPARKKSILYLNKSAPVSFQDASPIEIAMAITTLCQQAGVIVGRTGEYDPLRDLYTVIGKSRMTGKAQEFTVVGDEVGALIRLARMLNGGPMLSMQDQNERRAALAMHRAEKKARAAARA